MWLGLKPIMNHGAPETHKSIWDWCINPMAGRYTFTQLEPDEYIFRGGKNIDRCAPATVNLFLQNADIL
jgi:hypothetical protein